MKQLHCASYRRSHIGQAVIAKQFVVLRAHQTEAIRTPSLSARGKEAKPLHGPSYVCRPYYSATTLPYAIKTRLQVCHRLLFLDTPATALCDRLKILAVTLKCWNCCSLTGNTMAYATVPFRIRLQTRQNACARARTLWHKVKGDRSGGSGTESR